ncbi:Uncharacterized protein Fot_22442 [Forsythia ovata]|uniref:Uncharacterized protein n=1 Tax=Forsythia ovata TaxID=205694 RepID=A0ABD1UXS1_9LAMI
MAYENETKTEKSRRRSSPTCVKSPLIRRVVNREMCTSGRDLRKRANRPTPRTDFHNISKKFKTLMRNGGQTIVRGGSTGQLSGGRKSISRTSRHSGAARASGGLKYP